MVYWISYSKLKCVLLCSLFISFISVHAAPLPPTGIVIDSHLPEAQLIQTRLNEILAFDKPGATEKDADKAIDLIVKLRLELRFNHHIDVDIDEGLCYFQHYLEDLGLKECHKYFKKLKTKIKHAEVSNTYFSTIRDLKKQKKKGCPPSFSISVTVALVGVFLTRIPGCQTYGISLITAAGLKCVDIILDRLDEEHEESGSDCSICDDRHCPHHDQRKKERGE